jgi:DNA topoisomerase II
MAPRKTPVVRKQKTVTVNAEAVKVDDVSSRFKHMTDVEHVINRPATYIGAVAPSVDTMYTMSTDVSNNLITKTKVKYSRGLLKIVDELFVNAYDQCIRSGLKRPVTYIDICVNNASCTVINDGTTIPIVIHTDFGIYLPQFVFTKLRTSENFDDTTARFTGGTNGIGSKATNIMSLKFTIMIINTEYLKRYRQTCTNNMSIIGEPIIDDLVYDSVKGVYTDIDGCAYTSDITSITTEPDFKIFKSNGFNDTDIMGLIRKRCYDLAYCCNSTGSATNITVKFNNEIIGIDTTTIVPYAQLYGVVPNNVVFMSSPFNRKTGYTHWNIAIALNDRRVFDSVSFVNGINTYKGGTHVNYIKDQIIDKVLNALKKIPECKSMDIDTTYISKCIFLYVSMIQDKPAFNSQSKEDLQTDPTEYSEQFTVPDTVIEQLLSLGLTDMILEYANARGLKAMKDALSTKKHDNLSDIPKYEGAEYAGTKNSHLTSLILTEGDSAKAMVVAGISSIKNKNGESIGRKHYGVFPMRGKLLNVRDFVPKDGKISSSALEGLKKIKDNKEINSLIRILGLTADTKNTKHLRYNSIIIMTDADTDGSHIKGLIMNLINCFWSELFTVPQFIGFFITPIVIVKGNGVNNSVSADGRTGTVLGKDTIAFYSQPDFERWKTRNDIVSSSDIKQKFRGATCKYYKGLGTSTNADAKNYFSDIDKHVKWYTADNTANERMTLAFDSDATDDRKSWLLERPLNDIYSNSLDYTNKTVPISDFVDKELILFSMADNVRSIPSVIDGLKPSQRKVLYSVFKRGMGTTQESEVKVSQLAGYTAEHSDYHHGEASLLGTIVSMAQNYTGSNNINLLVPSGQFGSRHQNGADAASARYIFTYMSKVTPLLFPKRDAPVLNYQLSDDGHQIEPEYYVPIIPMVLVNGTNGIGTGWSTFVAQYNPLDIVSVIKSKINGTSVPDTLIPWYRGYNGVISPKVCASPKAKRVMTGIFSCKGHYTFTNEHLVITELPIYVASQTYKENVLDPIVARCEKDSSNDLIRITRVLPSHTDNEVCLKLCVEDNGMRMLERISDHLTLTGDAKKKKPSGTPDDVITDTLKLESTINTNNMHCWDSNGKMCKYANPIEIIDEHFNVRLELYGKRKAYEMCNLTERLIRAVEEAKYIIMIIGAMLDDTKRDAVNSKLQMLPEQYRITIDTIELNLEIRGVEYNALILELKRRGLTEMKGSYDYLIDMKQSALVYERVITLIDKAIDIGLEYKKLYDTTPVQLWIEELDAFVAEYTEFLKIEVITEPKKEETQPKKRTGNRKKQTVIA